MVNAQRKRKRKKYILYLLLLTIPRRDQFNLNSPLSKRIHLKKLKKMLAVGPYSTTLYCNVP
jgi:hypothetical protein